MHISDLKQFFQRAQEKLNERYGKNPSQEMSILSGMTKLTEEVGEVAEQVNLRRNRQESRKGEFNPEKAGSEFADVIICTGLLAQALDIDIEEALEKKIEVIRERFGE